MKKILLGFVLVCSLHFSFAQSAALDPTFGSRGIVKTDMGSSYSYNSSARQVLIQTGGSMFLILNGSTSGSLVSKRKSNGDIDSSYGLNGFSSSIPVSEAFAALQTDGKVVITGATGDNSFFVARLTQKGTADSTFGTNGIQSTSFNSTSLSRSVAIQSDGKIVVAGYTSTDDGNTYFALVRYTATGNTDNTFNGNGQAITDFKFKIPSDSQEGDSTEIHNAFAYSVAIQADGKIVAGGYANTGIDNDFALARYNTNGTADSTLDGDGLQTTDFGSGDMGYSLAIQTDGKILLAGYASTDVANNFAVARYNPNGSPDNSFNGTGKQTANTGSDMQVGNSIALQSTGKILVAGYTLNGDYNDFSIARFNTNGSPDNGFGAAGILTTDFVSSDDYAGSIAIQSDDKIVVAGYSYVYGDNTVQQIAVARYTLNGSPDVTFADNGKLEGDNKQGSTYFNATAVQANGKIIAAGRTWNGTNYDFAVTRFNVNGSVDNTFSSDGKQTTDFGGADEATAVAVQTDGKIVVAGNADTRFAIARYNADGTPDNTFNGNGTLTAAVGFSDILKSVALQSDGKIVVAGSTYTDENYDSAFFAIARFNSNGTPDNTFNGNGKALTELEASSSFGTSVGIQPNGKIVVAGRSFINNQNSFSLARYNADGSLDNTFSGDGKQYSVFGDDGYYVQSMAIQNDGKIVLGGYSETPGGVSTSFAAARYLANGDIDNTFGVNGFQSASLGPNFNFGKTVAINSNGRIAVGGTNGNYAMVLFKNNGNLDSTFGNNGILTTNIGLGSSSIQDLAFWNDKLYAVGSGQFPGTLGVVARYSLVESGPLAVSLLDFTATPQNKAVLLNWQIASEKELSGFNVQHSIDGISFTTLGFVAAKGNSGSKADYSITDKQPVNGTNFYRLQMLTTDGKFTYSKIVSVNFRGQVFSFKIFPNPVQSVLSVNASGDNENATFQVIDLNGRKIKEVQVSLNGNTSFTIPVNALPKGMYHLQLNTKTTTETKVFIKE